jgi:hypothetical protein
MALSTSAKSFDAVKGEMALRNLLKYPLKLKDTLVPKIGGTFTFGRVRYKVTYVNQSKLRFTATVIGILPPGNNKVLVSTTPVGPVVERNIYDFFTVA